ncbi:MAG: ABC transporter ATP-binding protein [Coriobacteriales bacterium]|nr:ABC transporter ATP-binding protein [Coriobacteriales bacterium]
MNSQVFKRLFSYFGHYKGKFTTAVVVCIIGTLFTVAAPVVLGEITTILYAGVSDHHWFVQYAADGTAIEETVYLWAGPHAVGKVEAALVTTAIVAILYVLSMVFCSFANKGMARVVAMVVHDLRSDVEDKMHKLTLNYYDTRANGDILSVVTNDVDAINSLLSTYTYQVINNAVSLVGTLVMLFVINPWLTLIAILMIPGTLLLTRPAQKISGKNYGAQQNLLGAVNGYVEEMYNGQNVVTSFNYQEKSIAKFDKMNEELLSKTEKAETYSGAVMPITMMVNNLGYAVSALVGCFFAIQGIMTVGNVQSALQYTKNIQQPFTVVSQMSGQLSTAMAAGKRIFELLDSEEEIPDPAEGKKPTKCDGSVSFEHVQFGYTPNNKLMTDVNFTAEPGKKIAIVGPTGAGKTTLINLLMRFYEIDGGRILVNGVDSKEMTRAELRHHFSMVLQETWLFEGTIRDNLKYGVDREVSDEEIVEAAKSVCADNFIRTMPGGYDMVLSKGAENISQGQRQLLTIARAIVANPEIMILDEATSNVDAHTEQTIQDAMAKLMENRTSFVIAHRLSTIRDAATILYMEHGDIKEVGDHDTLMALNGKYAALYNSQFA